MDFLPDLFTLSLFAHTSVPPPASITAPGSLVPSFGHLLLAPGVSQPVCTWALFRAAMGQALLVQTAGGARIDGEKIRSGWMGLATLCHAAKLVIPPGVGEQVEVTNWFRAIGEKAVEVSIEHVTDPTGLLRVLQGLRKPLGMSADGDLFTRIQQAHAARSLGAAPSSSASTNIHSSTTAQPLAAGSPPATMASTSAPFAIVNGGAALQHPPAKKPRLAYGGTGREEGVSAEGGVSTATSLAESIQGPLVVPVPSVEGGRAGGTSVPPAGQPSSTSAGAEHYPRAQLFYHAPAVDPDLELGIGTSILPPVPAPKVKKVRDPNAPKPDKGKKGTKGTSCMACSKGKTKCEREDENEDCRRCISRGQVCSNVEYDPAAPIVVASKSVSCQACTVKKTKCEWEDGVGNGTCSRCKKLSFTCEMPPMKRTYYRSSRRTINDPPSTTDPSSSSSSLLSFPPLPDTIASGSGTLMGVDGTATKEPLADGHPPRQGQQMSREDLVVGMPSGGQEGAVAQGGLAGLASASAEAFGHQQRGQQTVHDGIQVDHTVPAAQG